MRKVILFMLMTLVLSFTNAVVAQTTTLVTKGPQRFMVIKIKENVIVAPYVVKGVTKSVTHDKVEFFVDGESVAVFLDQKFAGVGKILPITKDANSDFYGVGSQDGFFSILDLKKIDLSDFHKPQPFELNKVALDQAIKFFEIDISIQEGALARMAAMGFYLNERALVFESDDPAIFLDLKGKNLDELPDKITISILGNGVIIERDCPTITESYTFTPGAVVLYRTKVKAMK